MLPDMHYLRALISVMAGFFVLPIFAEQHQSTLNVNWPCDTDESKVQVAPMDKLNLSTSNIGGSAGAFYEGSLDLYVTSNIPVLVRTDGGELENNGFKISPEYFIEDRDILSIKGKDEKSMVTRQYMLRGEYRLAQISDQPAGLYEGQISITIMPDLNLLGSCKE